MERRGSLTGLLVAAALLAAACGVSGNGASGNGVSGNRNSPASGAGGSAPGVDRPVGGTDEHPLVDLDAHLAEAARIPPPVSDAAAPPVPPSTPGGAAGFTRYVFRPFGELVLTSLVEGPRGAQVRCQDPAGPCSYTELAALADGGADPPPELGMERAELVELVAQLRTTAGVLERFADVEEACAAGYVSDRTQTPNMGSHFYRMDLIVDGEFDPASPEILIYVVAGGAEPTPGALGQCVDGRWTGGDMEIVAASFLLPHQIVGDDHPEGFAGPLDNWHVHHNLCREAGTDSIVPREVCEARGGRWSATLGWMIHAWVSPAHDNQLGVFSMWNPSVWPVGDPAAVAAANAVDVPGADGPVVPVSSFAFGRRSVEVPVGSEVVWVNADSVPHTVTAAGGPAGVFDLGVFGPGAAVRRTFTSPGRYSYVCTLHPDMTGTVVVTGT